MVNIVPKVFPDPPTSYLEIEKVYSSKKFEATEDGYFEFIGLAASGKGGSIGSSSGGGKIGGGSGGSGGIIVSVFSLNKGDEVTITISDNFLENVVIQAKGEKAIARNGGDGTNGVMNGSSSGTPGRGGYGGSATGGNVKNLPGTTGKDGKMNYSGSNQNTGGESVTNSYGGYNTTSGHGDWPLSDPTQSYVVILRGNTNIPLDQQNALDITSISLDISELQQIQTDVLMGNISVD